MTTQPNKPEPSTLGEQVAQAQAEYETWTSERKASVRLEGSSAYENRKPEPAMSQYASKADCDAAVAQRAQDEMRATYEQFLTEPDILKAHEVWHADNVPEYQNPITGAAIEANVRIETLEAFKAGAQWQASRTAPVCQTCNGRGMIGGFQGGAAPGYVSDPCPDCNAPAPSYTYSSTQATNCAVCGKHKHTPLRIDAMGGYVCLTCIDNKLGALLGEFGYQQAAQSDLDIAANRAAGMAMFHEVPEVARAEIAEAVRTTPQASPNDLHAAVADAVANYERMGAICEFEGNPMIYASTLTELGELVANAAPAQNTVGVSEDWRKAAQEFIDRVDSGDEIRSKFTYEKFKALLAAQEPK